MAQLYCRHSFCEQHLEMEAYVYHVGSFHYNWHEEWELIAVLEGEVEVCADGRTCRLSQDDVLLINANAGHATLSRSLRSTLLLLHVHPRFFLEYIPDFGRKRFAIQSNEQTRQDPVFRLLRRSMAQILLSGLSRAPEARLDLLCAFYTLVGVCREHFPPQPVHNTALAERQQTRRVQEMIAYLEEHYRERLSLQDTARQFHYNSSYVSQLFKDCMGINFYNYLTRIRLRHATRDLSETNRRIADIAADNGFTDLKSFNAKFREIFGRTPSDYRKSLGAQHIREDAHFKESFLDSDNPDVRRRLNAYLSPSSGEAQPPGKI